MANVHVLETVGGQTKLAMHIAVPAGTNVAGIQWSIALKNSGVGGKTILPDGDGNGGSISSAEKTAVVTNATVYEHIVTVPASIIPTNTAAVANAALDALFAAATVEVQPMLQARLNTFGFTR